MAATLDAPWGSRAFEVTEPGERWLDCCQHDQAIEC
jgi:hypothetical protein